MRGCRQVRGRESGSQWQVQRKREASEAADEVKRRSMLEQEGDGLARRGASGGGGARCGGEE